MPPFQSALPLGGLIERNSMSRSTIPLLAGFTVEVIYGIRRVYYLNQPCERISRKVRNCEENTVHNGSILDCWETYQSPIGVIERHYWARGAELEESGIDWRLVPQKEIETAQKRYETASVELLEARLALETLVGLIKK